ncbi:raf homolog serine/threonine-protein kinase Raf-like [Paramacrobiotus metropolitanus]|uniref:raf homolog serine/threonine-protein kinase Raf-like n=1 Tax=Paramacrobiotus metropolitanus TaxID=2943436 RepID=UPI0024461745|nr:raf homolog serine/threonine-protein kinase Raf-like [Paramacrobiotus metropolitanus]
MPVLMFFHSQFSQRIVDGYPPYIPEIIPKEFLKIIQRCVQVDLDKRITAKDVYNSLVKVQDYIYGSTWNRSRLNSVANSEEASGNSRPLIEIFGPRCAYDYEFPGDFIGQGTFGTVYKATLRDDQNYAGSCTVAVKEVLFKSDRENADTRKNPSKNDIELWQLLIRLTDRHPNVVTYHHVVTRKVLQGVEVIFMMDWCEDRDLEWHLAQCRSKKQRFRVTTALDRALQVSSGLAFLHQNKLIHGDLKPGNILHKNPPVVITLY